VLWACVAIGLLLVIMAVKIVGVGRLQVRWLHEEGEHHQARWLLVYFALLWGGLAIVGVGSMVHSEALQILGCAVVVSSFVVQVSVARDAARRRKADYDEVRGQAR